MDIIALQEEVARLTIERDNLLKFKTWVHDWLTYVGVPYDPAPEQTAIHGCRISERLKWLMRSRG